MLANQRATLGNMINTSPKARQVLQPVFYREYDQTFFNTGILSALHTTTRR